MDTTRIGAHEAKTRLSEYLNRVSYRGERFVVERHGKPVAALVSVEDLRRLVAWDTERQPATPEDEALRRAFEELGVEVHWPTGRPPEVADRKLVPFSGSPLSEDIVADRR